jgi:hypothetical protein
MRDNALSMPHMKMRRSLRLLSICTPDACWKLSARDLTSYRAGQGGKGQSQDTPFLWRRSRSIPINKIRACASTTPGNRGRKYQCIILSPCHQLVVQKQRYYLRRQFSNPSPRLSRRFPAFVAPTSNLGPTSARGRHTWFKPTLGSIRDDNPRRRPSGHGQQAPGPCLQYYWQ